MAGARRSYPATCGAIFRVSVTGAVEQGNRAQNIDYLRLVSLVLYRATEVAAENRTVL